jgi:hypothetical protein
MRFKIFFNKITNTLTIFEDDTGYVLLFLALVFAIFIDAIITFLSFLACSIVLVLWAKKAKTRDHGSMILAIGSSALSAIYCILISLCIILGTGSSSFIFMLQVLSVATVIYSIRYSARNKNLIAQYEETQDAVFAANTCQKAKSISIITLISLLAAFSCLFAFNVPTPEDTRLEKQQAQAEALIAESVSVWELKTIETDAIYGNTTKYDSYGNAYSGEFREFCAWTYPGGDVFEPRVIVDIDEKYEYTRFTGTIFTRPDQDEDLTITFKIFADGKCIYDSGEMRTATRAINLNLDITGVDKLTFQAYTDFNDATNPGVVLVNAFLHAK